MFDLSKNLTKVDYIIRGFYFHEKCYQEIYDDYNYCLKVDNLRIACELCETTMIPNEESESIRNLCNLIVFGEKIVYIPLCYTCGMDVNNFFSIMSAQKKLTTKK